MTKSITTLLLFAAIQSIMLVSVVKSFALQSARVARRCAPNTGRHAASRTFGNIIGADVGIGSSSSRTRQPAVIAAQRRQSPPVPLATRWMSSGPGEEGGPTIVDICRDKIVAALETEDVKVIGAYDDPNGSHISIEVTSELFEGKRLVQRQQLVYKALWEELKGAVHAVDSMVCKTPAEKK